jgi:hypothetical protein
VCPCGGVPLGNGKGLGVFGLVVGEEKRWMAGCAREFSPCGGKRREMRTAFAIGGRRDRLRGAFGIRGRGFTTEDTEKRERGRRSMRVKECLRVEELGRNLKALTRACGAREKAVPSG